MSLYQKCLDYGLSLPSTCQECPFDDSSVALRHYQNKKIFALFIHRSEGILLNLKCEPMQADFWRNAFEWVIPGFHMNKTHWNSILLNSRPDWEILQGMVYDSYTLTKPKQARYKAYDK